MRAESVFGRLSVFQLTMFKLFTLWVPVCPVLSSLGGSPLGGVFFLGALLIVVRLEHDRLFFSPRRMLVNSVVLAIVGNWCGLEFLQDSVIRPLKVGFRFHVVRCSALQIRQFPLFVETLPQKLGR